MLYVRNVSRTLSKSFFANIVNRFKPLSFFEKKKSPSQQGPNFVSVFTQGMGKYWLNKFTYSFEIMRLIKHLKMLAMTGSVYNY